MPTYVYRCRECGHEFELFQRISDAPITDCPAGHLGSVRRVMQPVGIAFKGSGFYVNDSTTKAEPTEKPSQSDGSGDSGSETKPAAESASPAPAESKPATTGSEPSAP